MSRWNPNFVKNGIARLRRWTVAGGGGTIAQGESETSAWYLAGGIDVADIVAAYQPKGAASLAASYINLANPGTYDLAAGSAPTFNTATGWTFNGSANYLEETASSPISNNFSVAVYGVPNTAGLTQCFAHASRGSDNKGWGFAANQVFITQKLGLTLPGVADYTASTLATPTVAAFFGMTKSGTTVKIYLNTTTETVVVGAILAPSLNGTVVGCGYPAGSAISFYKGTIVAISRYSAVLSDSQMSALATAMAAL